jgi:hypothetical protein
VYRRADLSRTFVLVVALLLTAVSTGAFAREYRIPDPHIERHPIDAFHPAPVRRGRSQPHRIGIARDDDAVMDRASSQGGLT